MTTITIDELKERTSEVFDRLADGEPISITRDGAVAGTLVPPPTQGATEPGPDVNPDDADDAAFWASWGRVWDAVGNHWPEGVTSVDAIREDRSRLDAVGIDRPES